MVLLRAWEATGDGPPVRTVIDHRGRPHTVVRGYQHVKAVLADPATYRPDNALDALTPLPVSTLRILTRYGFRLPPTLANNGGLSHPGIRDIVAGALHPDRVPTSRRPAGRCPCSTPSSSRRARWPRASGPGEARRMEEP